MRDRDQNASCFVVIILFGMLLISAMSAPRACPDKNQPSPVVVEPPLTLEDLELARTVRMLVLATFCSSVLALTSFIFTFVSAACWIKESTTQRQARRRCWSSIGVVLLVFTVPLLVVSATTPRPFATVAEFVWLAIWLVLSALSVPVEYKRIKQTHAHLCA